jgi:hypothetical protein
LVNGLSNLIKKLNGKTAEDLQEDHEKEELYVETEVTESQATLESQPAIMHRTSDKAKVVV